MSHIDRSSNLKEQFLQKALISIIPGVIVLGLGVTFIAYKSVMSTLGIVLTIIALGAIGYGVYQLTQLKKIPDFPVACPFCKHKNSFTEEVVSDVRCEGCQRMIPIYDGRVLQVWQVRCGFCNHLNFYSEKSTGLICESCNRVVPIANDGGLQAKATFENYTIHDDNRPYNLSLTDAGPAHNEDLYNALQQMLALNRNQVKLMLDELPVTLLTGIPKKKAELLKAQIEIHHGKADIKVSQ